MKKILVPTDFSIASQDAFKYALEISSIQNATIDIVHVYNGNLDPSDPAMTFSPGKTRQDILFDQLTHFKNSVENKNNSATLDIECKLMMGLSPSKTISQISVGYDLIIIGATGENDTLKKIMGHTSSRIAQNAVCPVMVIPKNTVYKGIEKIVYASNRVSAQTSIIKKIANWATAFNARIDFIHINEDNDLENFSATEEKILNSLFDNNKCNFSFNVLSLDAYSPSDGILDYSFKVGANLVVLVNSKSGLANNILGFSLTNKMISALKIPLLVYHNEKKKTKIPSSQ